MEKSLSGSEQVIQFRRRREEYKRAQARLEKEAAEKAALALAEKVPPGRLCFIFYLSLPI